MILLLKGEKEYKKVCENAYKNLYHNWDDTINEVYERYLYLIKEKKKN